MKKASKMNIKVLRTSRENSDFIHLIELLDEDLVERYGVLQKQFDPHNKVDSIRDVVIIQKDNMPVACGAFKEYDPNTIEIKRIFVIKEHRNQGLARLLVKTLEEMAREKGYKYAVLETGIGQPEAIGLYQKLGYERIQNYEPYIGNSYSVCMKKELS
jgi:ribosomal protein S18 acetylase RimI-like enzyme